MYSNRTDDADTYAKPSIIGTAMRGVNPLEYMVEAMSKPYGTSCPGPPPGETTPGLRPIRRPDQAALPLPPMDLK